MTPPPSPLAAQPQAESRLHLAVIGSGMAALRTIEDILARAPERYRITLFGAEALPGYNRIQLSGLLAGDKRLDDIVTHPVSWFQDRGITLHLGDPVITIDPIARRLVSQKGVSLTWDRLILATGAQPVIPLLPGADLDGVFSFRTANDVTAMQAAAARHARAGQTGKAVVIGGGVLGLEAAWGLKCQGMDVTVVHMPPTLMERQLDPVAGELLRRDLDRLGIACVTQAQASALIGNGSVSAVDLNGGQSRLPADLVVLTVGIRPDTALARQTGLTVNRGVVVGDDMRTSHPDIFAVGECAEHRGQCFGLVAPLWIMAQVCARQLNDEQDAAFAAPIQSTRLKIPGLSVFAAGDTPATANDDLRAVVDHAPDQGAYRKLVLDKGGRPVQALLYGDVAQANQMLRWLESGDDLSHLDAAALRPGCAGGCGCADRPTLADTDIVCHCNSVTKGTIKAAIATHGLTDLESVARCTQAGTGCGQCARLVAQILEEVQGADAAAASLRRAEGRRQAFRWWHHANATLMVTLLVTGLSLHFPRSWIAVLGFGWSYSLHKWSGLALCAASLTLAGLTLFFRRRWKLDLDGLMLFVTLPLLTVSGLAFLWPALLPSTLGGVRAVTWIASGHIGLMMVVASYLLHHLSRAPWSWWTKRKQRLSNQTF